MLTLLLNKPGVAPYITRKVKGVPNQRKAGVGQEEENVLKTQDMPILDY